PPAPAHPPHAQVRAAQPFAVVRWHVRREFELEAARDLGWTLAAHGEAAGHLEGEEVVDGLDLHEARFLAAGRHLALEKAAHVVRPRRDAGDVLNAQLLADLVERVRRAARQSPLR